MLEEPRSTLPEAVVIWAWSSDVILIASRSVPRVSDSVHRQSTGAPVPSQRENLHSHRSNAKRQLHTDGRPIHCAGLVRASVSDRSPDMWGIAKLLGVSTTGRGTSGARVHSTRSKQVRMSGLHCTQHCTWSRWHSASFLRPACFSM